MKRYMLISVVERELSYTFYNTFEEAQAQMKERFENSCADVQGFIRDRMADLDETSAWITDGNNHCDYDWWIVDLSAPVSAERAGDNNV